MIRMSDPRIICALSFRPGLLSFDNFSANPKKLHPRADSAKFFTTLGDFLLSWAVDDFLWYFVGISAIFANKECISPSYVQVSMWNFQVLSRNLFYIDNSITEVAVARCSPHRLHGQQVHWACLLRTLSRGELHERHLGRATPCWCRQANGRRRVTESDIQHKTTKLMQF